jgi:hypothetical protein
MIVSILSLAVLVITAYVASHRLSGFQTLLIVSIGALGILLVAVPQLSTIIALKLGVGRGTDLLLYFAIVAGLFVASHFFFRFKRQEAQLIAVVRALALSDAERDPANVQPEAR